MKEFELGISSEYVADWTLVDAIRELFQNALDQQTLDEQNIMSWHYDGVHMLQIRNKTSVLNYRSLLLGSSGKRNSKETIGKFGEGYKIATLVLLRLGKEVRIWNFGAGELWTARFIKSRRYGGAQILAFEVEQLPGIDYEKAYNDDKLVITIDKITPEEFEEIEESNLHMQNIISPVHSMDEGRILVNSKYAGKIYVNGLYVTTIDDLEHGYDIKPEYLKIDRDRRLVRDFDIQWLTSKMWNKTESHEVITMAKEGKKDVAFLSYQCVERASVAEQAHVEFRMRYGDKAIPVTSQYQVEELQKEYVDAKPIIVPEAYKHLITNSSTYSTDGLKRKRIGTPKVRLHLWFDKVREKVAMSGCISDELQTEFEDILEELGD